MNANQLLGSTHTGVLLLLLLRLLKENIDHDDDDREPDKEDGGEGAAEHPHRHLAPLPSQHPGRSQPRRG